MIQPAPSSASASAGRKIETAASLWSSAQSATSRSTCALCTAYANSGFGRSGAVLGQWHGVVRPRAVHGRTRHHDDLLDTRRARGVEQTARGLDVDPRRFGLVDLGARREGEVDQRVGRLQQRRRIRRARSRVVVARSWPLPAVAPRRRSRRCERLRDPPRGLHSTRRPTAPAAPVTTTVRAVGIGAFERGRDSTTIRLPCPCERLRVQRTRSTESLSSRNREDDPESGRLQLGGGAPVRDRRRERRRVRAERRSAGSHRPRTAHPGSGTARRAGDRAHPVRQRTPARGAARSRGRSGRTTRSRRTAPCSKTSPRRCRQRTRRSRIRPPTSSAGS